MITIGSEAIAAMTDAARASPRRRANHNLHPQPSDPIQRFFNAIEPGSYVRPHRHASPPRWELFVAVSGRAVVLGFDAAGRVTARAELLPGESPAVEIGAAEWHTVAALEPATVLLEVKPGPYRPLDDKDFAVWAPREGDDACSGFAAWFAAARPGETPSPE